MQSKVSWQWPWPCQQDPSAKPCTSQGAKWLFPCEPLGMGRWASVSLSPQGTQQAMGDRHPSHCSLSSWKVPKFWEKGYASSCRGHWELVLFTFCERSPGAGAGLTCTLILLPLLGLRTLGVTWTGLLASLGESKEPWSCLM